MCLGAGEGLTKQGLLWLRRRQKHRNNKPHLQTRMKKLQLVKKQLLLT